MAVWAKSPTFSGTDKTHLALTKQKGVKWMTRRTNK